MATSDNNNTKFFDTCIAEQSEYLVPWDKYDVAKLPLTFNITSFNKIGADPLVFLKPIMQKPEGGIFKDVVLGTPPSRILYDYTPYDEREKYKSTIGGVPEDVMQKIYGKIEPGTSKGFDLSIECTPELAAFVKTYELMVRDHVLANKSKFKKLATLASPEFLHALHDKPAADGTTRAPFIKTKIYFKDGAFDVAVYEAKTEQATSLVENRKRLGGSHISCFIRPGNVWVMNKQFGITWKLIGGKIEYRNSNVKPATARDLFAALNKFNVAAPPITAADLAAAEEEEGLDAPAAGSKVTVVDDDEEVVEGEEEVEVEGEEEVEVEGEEDADDDDADAEARKAEEEAAEAKKAEEAAAAKKAEDEAAAAKKKVVTKKVVAKKAVA